MKEFKYNGNLEEDINFLTEKAVAERNSEQRFFDYFCRGSIAFFAILLVFFKVPLLAFSIIIGSISGVYYFAKRLIIKANKEINSVANSRLNSLCYQLEKNGISVSKINLQSKVELEKVERYLVAPNMNETEKITVTNEVEKYWTFMDKSQQIQVLKYVRSKIIDNGICSKTEARYFLLEEDDKNTLDKPLKKVLKIDK